jgi:prepilin-type N-terminal cleavage/methylation domain-containing protein
MRKGFTLAEVLVTIAIIAIMAAVILPALNNQIQKGDTSRLASDLTSVQSGIQAFVSDIRRFPSTTDQLLNGATGSDIFAAPFTALDQSAWKGPYLSRDILSHTGGRASISGTFTITTSSTLQFLTVNISPVTNTQFENIELALDEGTASTTSTTTGNIRYSSGNTTLSFLAMPVR